MGVPAVPLSATKSSLPDPVGEICRAHFDVGISEEPPDLNLFEYVLLLNMTSDVVDSTDDVVKGVKMSLTADPIVTVSFVKLTDFVTVPSSIDVVRDDVADEVITDVTEEVADVTEVVLEVAVDVVAKLVADVVRDEVAEVVTADVTTGAAEDVVTFEVVAIDED
jgi:hypothetical protein